MKHWKVKNKSDKIQKTLYALLVCAFIVIGYQYSLPQVGQQTSPSQEATDAADTQDISEENPAPNELYVNVERVIDGDTIVIEGGEVVRYIGIDTPETNHPTIGLECYGPEATDKNKQLIGAQKVRLMRDVTDRDQYDRLLRYVFTEDGTFINYELAKQGYAQVLNYPPDNLFYLTILSAQNFAVENNTGIWRHCMQLDRSAN